YLGLPRALAGLCEEFARHSRMEIDFEHQAIPKLSADVTTCLYRVAQEAIRNAEKHSGARRVRVELAVKSDSIWVCVVDAGRGFDRTGTEGLPGLGLVSMTERVHGVGGVLSVRSAVDQGTRIEVSIPLERCASADSVAV